MDRREQGLKMLAGMVEAETLAEAERKAAAADTFAREMLDMQISHVFGELWSRPGLDARSRSLVTVGILIALSAEEELTAHLAIARRNGVTVEEIEEIISHATAYAGFPAAAAARRAAVRALPEAAARA